LFPPLQLRRLIVELETVKQQIRCHHAVVSEKEQLQRELQSKEETCNTLSKDLLSAREELERLKQRQQGKDKIELQNAELVEKLEQIRGEVAKTEDFKNKFEANKAILMNNDEMLRNIELELEEARAELSKREVVSTSLESVAVDEKNNSIKMYEQQLKEKDQAMEKLRSEFDRLRKKLAEKEKLLLESDKYLENTHYNLPAREGTEASDRVREVTKEIQTKLKKALDQKMMLEEQLKHAKLANEKHLIELATHREKARDMTLDVQEYKAEIEHVRTLLDLLPSLFGCALFDFHSNSVYLFIPSSLCCLLYSCENS
jgi:hypothetical protein